MLLQTPKPSSWASFKSLSSSTKCGLQCVVPHGAWRMASCRLLTVAVPVLLQEYSPYHLRQSMSACPHVQSVRCSQ